MYQLLLFWDDLYLCHLKLNSQQLLSSYFWFKNYCFLFRLKEGPENLEIVWFFTTIPVGLIESTTSRYKSFLDFPELKTSLLGVTETCSLGLRAKTHRWPTGRQLNKMFSLFYTITWQLQARCTSQSVCQLPIIQNTWRFCCYSWTQMTWRKPGPQGVDTHTHCDAPTVCWHHMARAWSLGTAPQHDYPAVQTQS